MTTTPAPLRQAWTFLAVTLGLSLFVFWGPIALAQVPTVSLVADTRGPLWAIILFVFGGFMPSIVAIVMSAISGGAGAVRDLLRRVVQFRLGRRWYVGAIVAIVAGALGQVVLALITTSDYDARPIVGQLGSAIPLIVLGPLSEELGWRGFVQGRLQSRYSALGASLIVGVVWGMWHLPLFYIVGSSQSVLGLPFGGFLVGTVSISVVFGWIYNNTGGSIWSAVFVHWIYTYSLQAVSSGVERTTLYNWLEYVPYLALAAAIVAIWGPKRLSKKEIPTR